jgi:hypothetical protein
MGNHEIHSRKDETIPSLLKDKSKQSRQYSSLPENLRNLFETLNSKTEKNEKESVI